jgi:hypothetical protein
MWHGVETPVVVCTFLYDYLLLSLPAAAMQHIAEISTLRSLTLAYLNITDDGLRLLVCEVSSAAK